MTILKLFTSFYFWMLFKIFFNIIFSIFLYIWLTKQLF